MDITKKLTTAFLLLSISVIFSTAQATEVLLSFPDSDIVGESVIRDHVDEVHILSFSWNVVSEAGKKSTTNVTISELSLIKSVDFSTASILTKAVMGENLGRAVLKFHGPEGPGGHFDFLVLTLNDATILSVSSNFEGGQQRPLERVVFAFSSISGVYTTRNQDGTPGNVLGWDIAANKEG